MSPSKVEPSTPRASGNGVGPIAAYLSLCFIWGSTFLAIRVAVETMPPALMIGGRCLIAGLLMAGYMVLRGVRLPHWRGLASAAVSGLLLFVSGQALLAFGETMVPSGEAGVLNATLSLFMPLAAWLLATSAPPGPAAAAGLAVGFVGVVVLARPHGAAIDPLGLAAVVGSALSWAFGTAVARRWPPSPSAGLSSGLQLLFGGVLAMALSGIVGEWTHFSWAAVSGRSLVAFFYLVTAGSLVAFAAFGWLVQVWPPERLATYTYINPVVALGIGALMAGERVGAREVAATALILAAVALVMFGSRLQRRLRWGADGRIRRGNSVSADATLDG